MNSHYYAAESALFKRELEEFGDWLLRYANSPECKAHFADWLEWQSDWPAAVQVEMDAIAQEMRDEFEARA